MSYPCIHDFAGAEFLLRYLFVFVEWHIHIHRHICACRCGCACVIVVVVVGWLRAVKMTFEYLFHVVRSRCVQMRAQSNGHQWDSVFIVEKSVCLYIVVVLLVLLSGYNHISYIKKRA